MYVLPNCLNIDYVVGRMDVSICSCLQLIQRTIENSNYRSSLTVKIVKIGPLFYFEWETPAGTYVGVYSDRVSWHNLVIRIQELRIVC